MPSCDCLTSWIITVPLTLSPPFLHYYRSLYTPRVLLVKPWDMDQNCWYHLRAYWKIEFSPAYRPTYSEFTSLTRPLNELYVRNLKTQSYSLLGTFSPIGFISTNVLSIQLLECFLHNTNFSMILSNLKFLHCFSNFYGWNLNAPALSFFSFLFMLALCYWHAVIYAG